MSTLQLSAGQMVDIDRPDVSERIDTDHAQMTSIHFDRHLIIE
jgi:hypothetical protein